MLLGTGLGGGGGLAPHVFGVLGHGPRHRDLVLVLLYPRAQFGNGTVAAIDLAQSLARGQFGVSNPRLELADRLAGGFEGTLRALTSGAILGDMRIDELGAPGRGRRKRAGAMGLRTVTMRGNVDDRNLPVILEAVTPRARRRKSGRFGGVIEAVPAMVAALITPMVPPMVPGVVAAVIARKFSTGLAASLAANLAANLAGGLALRPAAQHFQRFAQPVLGFL